MRRQKVKVEHGRWRKASKLIKAKAPAGQVAHALCWLACRDLLKAVGRRKQLRRRVKAILGDYGYLHVGAGHRMDRRDRGEELTECEVSILLAQVREAERRVG